MLYLWNQCNCSVRCYVSHASCSLCRSTISANYRRTFRLQLGTIECFLASSLQSGL